jgi:hypothetical protein
MSSKLMLSPDTVFMQNRNAARVTGWLASILQSPSGANGDLSLTLAHFGPEGTLRTLREFPVDGIADAEACHELVRSIESAAMDDASQLPGMRQRYQLTAASLRGNEIGSLIITYDAIAGSWSDGELQPNERGLLQQALQHNEKLFVMLMQTVGPMVESMGRRIAQQDHLIERGIERQHRFIDEKEELGVKRLERDLAIEAARKRQDIESLQELSAIQKADDLRKFLMEKLGPLFPIVANRVAGANVVPTAASPVEQMVAELSQHLTEGDVAKLIAPLPPQLGALLRELLVRETGRAPGSAGGSPPPPSAAPTAAPATSVDFDPFTPIAPAAVSSALQVLKTELLPWASSSLSEGKDPVTEKPMGVMLLAKLVRRMTPTEYEDLITRDARLSPAERKTLAALLTRLELGPGTEERGPKK